MNEQLSEVSELNAIEQLERLKERVAFTAGLRELANFLEEHPELPLPAGALNVSVVATNRDELVAIAKTLGSFEKKWSEKFFAIQKKFGPAVQYEAFSQREVICEKRVVGTRTVPAHVEEVVEWNCAEVSLLS